MGLFFALLPLYLLGNLHCLGMCGPLVALLASHPHRKLYFVGRLLSFTLAGWAAGAVGAVVNFAARDLYLPSLAALLFGGVILIWGLTHLGGWRLPWGGGWMRPWHTRLSTLVAADHAMMPLFFGLATVLLPCGQTIVVFSACAVEGSPLVGALNGLLFAALTSPSLLAAMGARSWLRRLRGEGRWAIGLLALVAGGLAICRGLADLELIPHLVFAPMGLGSPHLALF
jgi:uncharacterized protein